MSATVTYHHKYLTGRLADTVEPFPEATHGVLSSFFLAYGGDDQHVNAVAVYPENRSILFTLNDKDKKEQADYYAGYAVFKDEVRGLELREISGHCTGSCSVSLSVPEEKVFVLRGFEFRRALSDFHLYRLAVEMRDSLLWVTFRDNKVSGHENYNYRVAYAFVPRSAFLSVDNESASGKKLGLGIGKQYQSIKKSWHTKCPVGVKAIQGFNIAYDSDHHVKALGANTPDGIDPVGAQFNVLLHDKNGDDMINGIVRFAVFK